MTKKYKNGRYSKTVKNATGYADMQELLAASDVLVTDYSSSMFDFVNTKRPCFLYVPDLANYKAERDNYFELEELPFPFALSNGEMIKIIRNFDKEKYEDQIQALFDRVELKESGRASEKTAEYILDWMKSNSCCKS